MSEVNIFDHLNDDIDMDKKEAEEKRLILEKNLKNIWGFSSLGIESKKAAMSMLSTKNGMYARIPLYCKKEKCPYGDRCLLLRTGLAPYGEPCPKEVAEIELRYEAYNKDFDLDNSSFTDKNLVLELINYDIMLDRLRAIISKEEVLVVDVVTGISEQGEEFTHPEVSKTWEAYERVEKKRNNIYNMMLATRESNKNKKDDAENVNDIISAIMNKTDFVIDVKPENIK